jgi:hypothetical protein
MQNIGNFGAGLHPIQTVQSGASIGPPSRAPFGIARFFIVLTPSHFLLDSGMFDQFAKSLDGIVNRLMLAHTQPNHKVLLLNSFALRFKSHELSQRKTDT